MVTRAERARSVAHLRGLGLTYSEIARRLGISRSYTGLLVNDPDGTQDRARKARYGGRCEVCGAPTDGSGGRARAPRHCRAHHPGPEWQRAHAPRPAQRDLCILIDDGYTGFSELRDAYECSSGYAAATLHRMLYKNGYVRRVARGRYQLTAKGRALANTEPGGS